jgi:phosphoribosylformylglycinamidine cyclo-ligase
MGSNGLTSARHDVFAKYLAQKYPESYDHAVPEELVYSGGLHLTDPVEGSPLDAGKLVLSPTRTYAPVVKKMLDAFRSHPSNPSNPSNRSLRDLHGMVHCSGGAQTKVLHFIKNLHVIKDNLFPIPPLFRTIHEQSATDWSEMYKVFNMGHRLEVYLPAQYAQEVIDIARSFNIEAQIIGRVEARPEGAKVTLHTENGIFEYE